MASNKNYERLKNIASLVRISALENTVRAGRGHLGGSFSCVELLVSLYYGGFIRINPKMPKDSDRDYFIMGKGHACLALYPILLDLKFISKELYLEYGKNGSGLGGQLDTSIPGVEYNTGSLGHALGICAGIAKAAKIDNRDNRSIAMIGDAECDEGSIWEAILFASEHKLNNLICIIDRNRLSVTKKLDPKALFGDFKKKMNLFNWECHEIDGHNFHEIIGAFNKSIIADRPTMILANTIKGKGVSFMENDVKWHHSIPSENEIKIARKELKMKNNNI